MNKKARKAKMFSELPARVRRQTLLLENYRSQIERLQKEHERLRMRFRETFKAANAHLLKHEKNA
jgi:sigma54-dependent transcription regulator